MTQNKFQVWDDVKHQNIVNITAIMKEDKPTLIQFRYLESNRSTVDFPVHGKADDEGKEVKRILWMQCCKQAWNFKSVKLIFDDGFVFFHAYHFTFMYVYECQNLFYFLRF